MGLTFDFVELRSVRSAPASVPFGVLLFAQKRAKGSFEPACAIAGNKGSSNRAGSWALEKAHRSFLRPPHKAGTGRSGAAPQLRLLRQLLLPAYLVIGSVV